MIGNMTGSMLRTLSFATGGETAIMFAVATTVRYFAIGSTTRLQGVFHHLLHRPRSGSSSYSYVGADVI